MTPREHPSPVRGKGQSHLSRRRGRRAARGHRKVPLALASAHLYQHALEIDPYNPDPLIAYSGGKLK